jgi:hypothetical protein
LTQSGHSPALEARSDKATQAKYLRHSTASELPVILTPICPEILKPGPESGGSGQMRNKLISSLAGSAFSLAASGLAGAADMPVKAPPALATRAALPSWEGFYLGGDIGYGIGISKLNVPETFLDGNFFGSHGVIGGVLGGYNHMLAPRWLLGIEADASWSDIDHTEHFNSFGETVNAGITEKHA